MSRLSVRASRISRPAPVSAASSWTCLSPSSTSQHSTGPRTGAGKARSSQNAVKHGFTGRLLVGLQYGPFADNPAELQEFIQSVLEELQPGSAQERAEALHLAGLYVRRARLVVLEALALQHATRTGPAGLPGLLAEPTDRERAGARALTPELFDRLPRYEGHLSRELDRSLARYRRLQDERQARESARAGAGRPGPLRARLTPWSGSVGDTGPGQQAAPSYWPGNPRELGEIVVGAGAVTAGLSVRPRTLFRAPAVGRAFLPGLPVRMTLSDAVYVPQQPSALAPALRSPGRPLGR